MAPQSGSASSSVFKAVGDRAEEDGHHVKWWRREEEVATLCSLDPASPAEPGHLTLESDPVEA